MFPKWEAGSRIGGTVLQALLAHGSGVTCLNLDWSWYGTISPSCRFSEVRVSQLLYFWDGKWQYRSRGTVPTWKKLAASKKNPSKLLEAEKVKKLPGWVPKTHQHFHHPGPSWISTISAINSHCRSLLFLSQIFRWVSINSSWHSAHNQNRLDGWDVKCKAGTGSTSHFPAFSQPPFESWTWGRRHQVRISDPTHRRCKLSNLWINTLQQFMQWFQSSLLDEKFHAGTEMTLGNVTK